MKKSIHAILLTLALAQGANSALLAYWNFNGLAVTSNSTLPVSDNSVPDTIPADTGNGTIVLTSWAGGVNDFAGSTVNATSGTGAGVSLSLVPSTNGTGSTFPGNGSYIEITTLNFTGVVDPAITYASQRTATGFNSGVWSFSVDGTNFTSLPAITPAAAFAVITIDLTSFNVLDNAPSVTFRYTLSGATNVSGNNRIDNLQIVSDYVPVPEPSVAILGVLAGLSMLRRRR